MTVRQQRELHVWCSSSEALLARGIVIVVGRPKRKRFRRMPVKQEFGNRNLDRRQLLATKCGSRRVCDWVISWTTVGNLKEDEKCKRAAKV